VEHFIRKSGGNITTDIVSLRKALVEYREKFIANQKTLEQ